VRGVKERRKYSRRIEILLILLLALGLGAVLFRLVFYESNAWTRTVTIGGRMVEVRIRHVSRRAFIQLGHDFLVGGGGDKYTTRLMFPDEPSITFVTTKEPVAIWELDGDLYAACRTGDWLVGRLDDSGNLVPITRKELPEGLRTWNLEDEEEFQRQLDRDFEAWGN